MVSQNEFTYKQALDIGQRKLDSKQYVDMLELMDALEREKAPLEISPQNLPYGVDHWIHRCVQDGLGSDPYINELHWRYLHRPVSREYIQK